MKLKVYLARIAASLLGLVIGGLAVAGCSVNDVPPATVGDAGDGGPGVDSSADAGGGDAGKDGNICVFGVSKFGDGCVFGP